MIMIPSVATIFNGITGNRVTRVNHINGHGCSQKIIGLIFKVEGRGVELIKFHLNSIKEERGKKGGRKREGMGCRVEEKKRVKKKSKRRELGSQSPN